MVAMAKRARDPGPRGGRSRGPVPVEARTDFVRAEISVDRERPEGRLLRLDGQEASHVDLGDPTRIEFPYVRRLADLVDLLAAPGSPVDAVFLGGGGFTLPRYLAATRPRSRVEVFEHDGALVALAREHLGLRSSPALRVRVLDARVGLARRADASADLVVLDAFTGPLVPAHLTTLEFLDEVRRVLRPGGLFAANLIDVVPLQFARAAAATVLARFGHACLLADRRVLRGGDGGNLVLAASDAPLALDALRARAAGAAWPEQLVDPAHLPTFAGDAPRLRDGVAFPHKLARLVALWGGEETASEEGSPG